MGLTRKYTVCTILVKVGQEASASCYLVVVLSAHFLMFIQTFDQRGYRTFNQLELGGYHLDNRKLHWVHTTASSHKFSYANLFRFLLVGRLSDIFGRKWMVMGTSLLGLLGCVVGGTAKSIDILIVANLMNGIAAAGQLSFGIVLGELVPNKHRGPIVTVVFLSSLPFAGKSPAMLTTLWKMLIIVQSSVPSSLVFSSTIPQPAGAGPITWASSFPASR
jgi:MFS family permease